jgi:hypothetical protein
MSNSIPQYLDASIKQRLSEMAKGRHEPVWVVFDRIYCAHSREIVGWHSPEPDCDCESCGHFSVPCYVRVPGKLNTMHWRCSNISQDGLFVNEEHWVHGMSSIAVETLGISNSPPVAGELFEAYRQTVPILPLNPCNS